MTSSLVFSSNSVTGTPETSTSTVADAPPLASSLSRVLPGAMAVTRPSALTSAMEESSDEKLTACA